MASEPTWRASWVRHVESDSPPSGNRPRVTISGTRYNASQSRNLFCDRRIEPNNPPRSTPNNHRPYGTRIDCFPDFSNGTVHCRSVAYVHAHLTQFCDSRLVRYSSEHRRLQHLDRLQQRHVPDAEDVGHAAL